MSRIYIFKKIILEGLNIPALLINNKVHDSDVSERVRALQKSTVPFLVFQLNS